MPTYLVTGGCGFIGSHLTKALVDQGHHVLVLDDLSNGKVEHLPAEAEFIEGDIRDTSLVQHLMKQSDGCFHLAAIASVERSTQDWLGTHQINLTATVGLFEAAKQGKSGQPIPVVYASSAAVYGDADQLPLTENSPTNPQTPYGADKYGCEMHGAIAAKLHHVPTTGLRFFNVYGKNQDPKSPYSGVIAIFLERIKNNLSLDIFGDGKQTRDFVHVSDAVNYMLKAMSARRANGEIYNVCTGQKTSILELAHLIAEILNKQAEFNFKPARAGDIRDSIGSAEKAKQELGVVTECDLATGLKKTFTS